jgi:hypothetical protein
MPADIASLRGGFEGQVLLPEEDGYDQARRVWNAMVNRRPAVIARCAGTADVAAAVRFGRGRGLEIGVRGGGHNILGLAVPDGGLMIDLSLMGAVRVNPGQRRGWVQGGAARRPRPGRSVGRAGHHGRQRLAYRCGWPDARRGDGLACPAVRPGLRQRGPVRDRVRRRRDPARKRYREPGPVLGAARRRRKLRDRHPVRVPPAPDRHRRPDSRPVLPAARCAADAAPVARPDRGCAAPGNSHGLGRRSR